MAAINRRTLVTQFKPAPRRAPTVCELTIARRAMACEFAVTFPSGCREAVELGCAALDEVERLESKLSVFLEDSDITRVNRRASIEPVGVDAEVYAVLQLASRVNLETDGAFDAAIGASVKVCGSQYVVLDDEHQRVCFLRPGVAYNLGAIGKGFAIDRALRHVKGPALMQGGQSSIKAIGTWSIAIGTAAHVRLRSQAIGTSGTDHQAGHILDPRVGRPVGEGLLSASAITASAAEADALSTAFYVLGVEGTKQYCRTHREVSAVLVTPTAVVTIGPAEVEVLK